jgi:hypothetical protein
MWDALAITEEDAEGLAELARLELSMAKAFAERARTEEDPDTANALGRTAQRFGRCYRQSLALKSRLAREIAAAERAAAEAPRPRDEARISARVDEVRQAVERVLWTEAERPDWTEARTPEALELLDAHLEVRALDDRFADRDLDAQVADLCRALGLDPDLARRWRELPEPLPDPQDSS